MLSYLPVIDHASPAEAAGLPAGMVAVRAADLQLRPAGCLAGGERYWPGCSRRCRSQGSDSFYCHNVVVALWADAVANRLEGLAIYLLSDELPEVFLDNVRGRDDVSFALVVGLLGAETHRRADVVAALAGQ